ncbi:MAG: hypothetical protein HeimC3_05570 [Candidatus Heimdallarchaeota archaeon LC_3]|nr:MAG: hypothetical protein HeimC3_05570 [Candidatus Heimdallarchaeota archaeon LC_3]
MPERTTVGWFVLIIGLSASIFFFLINEDDNAINMLFLGFYSTISVLFLLRIYFYLHYKATLNEIYFFSLSNIIPTVIFFISPIIPMSKEKIIEISVISLQGPEFEQTNLQIGILSILAFPYLIFSTILLIRSFTHYKFIRLTPHSERGPSAEFSAILTFFIFGILLIVATQQSKDLLSLIYGLFYLFSGIGFLFGR